MRNILGRTGGWTMIASAALLVAGCGGGDEATNAADVNALDANAMLDQPGNDASAMETAANAAEPAVTDTGNQGADSTDVLGNTSGGDTGGNTIDSNISGM